jgi:glycosyltransferase involved in cell wall biosynthesis
MKIFIAVHHYPPNYRGGAELRTHRTAQALLALGHQVQVFCIEKVDVGPADGIAWQDEIYEGVPLRRATFDYKKIPDPFLYRYRNPWIETHLGNYLAEIKPDIFHLFGGYLLTGSALDAAEKNHIPCVVSLTDYYFMCSHINLLNSSQMACSFSNSADACLICAAKAKRRYQYLERLIPGFTVFFLKRQQTRIQAYKQRADYLIGTLNKAKKMIAPSQFLRSIYIQGGTDPEKIIYSRQGRDFPHLSTQEIEKPPAAYLRVGYIGQLTHIKGSHILLQALQHLPGLPIQVDLYGDLDKFPDYVKKLRKLARKDQRIRLDGLFTPNQMRQVYQSLDVVVVPSIWYENSPNVILEAFGHKTPVIASNLGGMAELVEDGRNGLLFEVNNPASLADQLRRLVEDRSLLGRLRSGIAPLRTTADEIAELCQVYASVLAK